jgi:hypothetical protein
MRRSIEVKLGFRVEQMAEEFPDVRFDGLDIGEEVYVGLEGLVSANMGSVPVPTLHPPANVHYEIADFTQGLCYEDASIDMVHTRQIIMGVRPLSLSPGLY